MFLQFRFTAVSGREWSPLFWLRCEVLLVGLRVCYLINKSKCPSKGKVKNKKIKRNKLLILTAATEMPKSSMIPDSAGDEYPA